MSRNKLAIILFVGLSTVIGGTLGGIYAIPGMYYAIVGFVVAGVVSAIVALMVLFVLAIINNR